jgi:hypothetical protein
VGRDGTAIPGAFERLGFFRNVKGIWSEVGIKGLFLEVRMT